MFVIYDIQEGMPASYFFADLVSYMMVGSNWGLIISSGVVEFIFAALGVWFSWRIISRTSVSGVEDAAAILELAVPYPQTPEYTAVDSGFDGYAPSGDYDSDKNSYKD